ncbi:hypothetical protein CABS03_08513 [Colletotrichum abscissum]|uniref:Aminotransferase class I/classII large domain-containing protein n=1 Tax=Colletotrichum abscissum TaxID=1671311 RepID=A0A9Q0B9K5_9PEZI|nr:hypothetical protein CABS02_01143 [Colletotrichum abscissum]
MGEYINSDHASIPDTVTDAVLKPARRTVPASKWGVAAQCTTEDFKTRTDKHKPLAKDWNHRLTHESTARTGSSLKAAFKHLQNPDVISLGGGIPLSEFLPFETLSFTPSFVPSSSRSKSASDSSVDDACFRSSKTDLSEGRSVFDISVALNYGQGSGSPQLLRWIIEHTEMVHNPPYADWGCTMTVGNTSALDMALRMLAKPGDYVLSEKFTYSTAVETAKPMGVKFLGVDMDGEGLLPESILQSPADLLNAIVPTYLGIDVDGRVMRMDSFSKVISPGSRIGWITAPQAVVERYKTHADVSTQGPSGFSQLAFFKLLDEFWGHAGFLEWMLHIRGEYTERRDFMVRACEQHLPREIVAWKPARAGMFQWLGVDWQKHPDASTKSPNEIEEEIWQEALAQGALIARGSWFNANKHIPLNEIFFRTTFAAAPLVQIEEAVKRIDSTRLLDLPLECLDQIFEDVVAYDEESEFNLRDATRLLRVSKIFEIIVMRAIYITKLLHKMRRNPEVGILAKQDHSHMASPQCRVQHRGNASFFLAKYLMIQPYRHLPWSTSLATVINAITDRTIRDDGLNLDSEERYAASSLLGSVMEAAIRSGSSNLAVLLINYEINTSRERITKTVRGKEIKGVRFYDLYFWRLAMAFDDLETMSALLDAADRRVPSKALGQILLEAVCAQQLEILQLILDNQMPHRKKGTTFKTYYGSNRRNERLKQAIDTCLEEAVKHGHSMVFNVLAHTPYALERHFYQHSWKKKWGFDPSIQSTSDYCRPARSLIEVAASRGDEVTIRELLSKGHGPFGLGDNAKPHHGLNPYHRLSHLRGLMPMIAAAKSRHVGAALALIRGHFKCDAVRWLLIIGTVLEGRDQQQPHRRHVNPKPSSTSNIDADDGERRVQRDRDVKFWQELIDAGFLDLQHSAKGCQCSETPMAMAATHPTRMAIEAARNFVCERLVIPSDAEYRECGDQSDAGWNPRQFPEDIRTPTGIILS